MFARMYHSREYYRDEVSTGKYITVNYGLKSEIIDNLIRKMS